MRWKCEEARRSRTKPAISMKNRRKRAGWNVDYLETRIRQTA
jgi:hypothetical protein